jgi:hypothetical protein
MGWEVVKLVVFHEEAHCIMSREAWRNGELWIKVFANILITVKSTEVGVRNISIYVKILPFDSHILKYKSTTFNNGYIITSDTIWDKIGEYETIENLIGSCWEYQNLLKYQTTPFPSIALLLPLEFGMLIKLVASNHYRD